MPRSTSTASRGQRLTTTAIAVAFALFTLAGSAIAGHLGSGVKSYTGCLNTGGTLTLIREGNAASKACPTGSVEAHFSGGDITGITVGTGLTGGGSNGEITIALDAKYGLRQDCADGQVVKWDAGDDTWACADDDDTTYDAGTGLDLSGTTFSIDEAYRLPQDCETDDVLSVGASGWDCGHVGNAPLAYYVADTDVRIPDDDALHEIVRLRLPAGKYAVTATGEIDGADLGDESRGTCYLSGPSLFMPNGYSANVTTGGGVIAITTVVTLAADASIFVQCNAISAADQADADSMQIVAIAVS